MTDPSPRRAALAVLFILQCVMLGALYAGVPPHPPPAIPLFAMGPFLGASLGLAASAFLMADHPRAGAVLSALAALAALISFGPQKYTDPALSQIWPAVVTAQAACLVLGVGLLPARIARAAARP